tara:strand:+ start:2637 stop:3365 length:729 start_codon:yes stop_codon:yes gene_type:complete
MFIKCIGGKEKSMAKVKAGTSTQTTKLNSRADYISNYKAEMVNGIINNYNSANQCLEDALKHRIAVARILVINEKEYDVIDDKKVKANFKKSWQFGASNPEKLNDKALENWNKNFKKYIKSYNFLNACFKLRKWLTDDGLDIDRKRIKQAMLSPQTIANMTGSRTLGDELGKKVEGQTTTKVKGPKKVDYQKQVEEFKQLIEKGISSDDADGIDVDGVKMMLSSIQNLINKRGVNFVTSVIN